MDTKKIAVFPVDEKTFADYSDAKLKRVISLASDNFSEKFSALCAEFKTRFAANEWIQMGNKDVYYINDIVGLMPNLNNFDSAGHSEYYGYSESTDRYKFGGFQGDLMTGTEARKCFNDRINYFRNSNGWIAHKNGNWYEGLTYKNGSEYWWMYTNNSYKYAQGRHDTRMNSYHYNISMLSVPIYRFNGKDSSPATALAAIFYWFEYNLTPKTFNSANTKKLFNELKKFYATQKEFLKTQGEQIALDEKKLFEAVKAGKTFDFLKLDFLKEKTIDGREYETNLRDELLSCDNRRVALDRYDEKILTDPNRGHWDLWDLPEEDEHGIKLNETIYARNPAADVNAAGIVGIDFGTKSTVVVYENERGEIIPLQVGKGDYSKGIKAENYENPTIIEFRHVENFLEAYAARAGRPKTSWNDVTVSHTARTNLQNTNDSSLFASFFENIKQWCGNIQYTTKIRDHDGAEKDLPPFLDISKDEFNPLEYYAYYLGSYINHMLRPNHIFMKYILSFPVMYERNIRERMLKAFRAGILKSLPTALLDNEDAMKDFQVVEGTSEPAAYAITALDGYGFLNGEENDGVYYSVFDFGGGTTDFDFGVLKLAEDDDADFYDYVLTHFGAHGDRTLGGENLLRLMAFEIFKANSDKLLKPRENSKVKIPFTWAAEKTEFAGSEGLIRSSQEANLNMHNLMEALRPIWEAPNSDDAKKILESGTVTLTVFDDAGKELTGFTLSIGSQKTPDEVNPLPTVRAKPTTTAFEVPATEFNKIYSQAWEGDFNAIKQLGEWASRGHNESLVNLEKLSTADYVNATEILWKLKADKKIPDAEPEVKVEPKKIAPLVDLNKILRERICRGIDSFFISLRDAFDKISGGEDNGVAALSDVTEIGIFLAGNSTKSALVKKLFEEYIDTENGKARKLLGFGNPQKMPRFVLYPPLGTDEAYKIQESKDLPVDKNNFAAPTGKTGVAFGLLRCRDGSAIRVVDISPEGKDKKQVPFQFYIGRARMGKFKIVLDKSTKLGKWCKFIGAKLGVFDLLYTDQSIAATNNAPASIAKRLTIHVDADAEANIYIKAVESNKICYAVSKGEPTVEVEGKLITLD